MLFPFFLLSSSTFVSGIAIPSHSSKNARVFEVPIGRSRGLARQRLARSTAQVGLGDSGDERYSISVNFGGSETQLLLDTGSSDLWATTDKCTASHCSGGLPLISQPSNLSAISGLVRYGDGTSAEGLFATTPTFSFAGSQLPLTDQVFIAVNNTNATSILNSKSVGILPLGFPLFGITWRDILSATNGNTEPTTEQAFASWKTTANPVNRMVLDGSLDSPMFSVALQRDTVDIGGNQGILTIGGLPSGVDNSTLAWGPVRLYNVSLTPSPGEVAEQYPVPWELFIDDVYLDGVVLPKSNLTASSIRLSAIVDTGDAVVRGPADVVNEIYSRVSSSYQSSSSPNINKATFSCLTPHTLAFSIAGKMFPIDPRDFILPSNDNEVKNCVPAVVGYSASDLPQPGKGTQFSWSLGDPFLKSVLTAFYYGNITHPSVDLPRMGLLSTVPANASALLTEVISEAQKKNGGNEYQTIELAPTTLAKAAATFSGVAQAPERDANGAIATSTTRWSWAVVVAFAAGWFL
ncbi:Peptidase A1 domain-containing protein [Mycena chlorophos]|uniref:Peptidase A1 domain-containing protein n=1 Tax=Mycena chlorophos TaxID=658473 RepID=A0A8H6VWQ5_MYCCL|nr:Peptidase A1 domain-containing protein [Mycena chlorophos]